MFFLRCLESQCLCSLCKAWIKHRLKCLLLIIHSYFKQTRCFNKNKLNKKKTEKLMKGRNKVNKNKVKPGTYLLLQMYALKSCSNRPKFGFWASWQLAKRNLVSYLIHRVHRGEKRMIGIQETFMLFNANTKHNGNSIALCRPSPSFGRPTMAIPLNLFPKFHSHCLALFSHLATNCTRVQ